MLIFIAEAASDEAARDIALSAGPGPTSPFVGFGVARGRLCAVLVAESFIQGVEAWEGPDAIERFRRPLLAALDAGR